jgi:hypothetical protein
MTRSRTRPRKFRCTIPEIRPQSMPLQVWRNVCRTVLDKNVPFAAAWEIEGRRGGSQTKRKLVHLHSGLDKQLWFDI